MDSKINYNFQKFENVRGKFEDRITITRSYSFGLPNKFYDENQVKDYKYVVIFFDKENKAIGLHFTNDEGEKSKFKIIHHPDYGGGISARSFFKSYNIDPQKYHGKYHPEIIDDEKSGRLFVIHLKE